MHIDKHKKEDHYEDSNAYYYKDGIEFIQGGLLGFCGCGDPESNLNYLREVLSYIDLRVGFRTSEEKLKEIKAALFPEERAMDFIFYVLDEMGLVEHGSCLPGWLSPKGRELLEDLEELKAAGKI